MSYIWHVVNSCNKPRRRTKTVCLDSTSFKAKSPQLPTPPFTITLDFRTTYKVLWCCKNHETKCGTAYGMFGKWTIIDFIKFRLKKKFCVYETKIRIYILKLFKPKPIYSATLIKALWLKINPVVSEDVP